MSIDTSIAVAVANPVLGPSKGERKRAAKLEQTTGRVHMPAPAMLPHWMLAGLSRYANEAFVLRVKHKKSTSSWKGK